VASNKDKELANFEFAFLFLRDRIKVCKGTQDESVWGELELTRGGWRSD
jgi:hypothetical protein